MDSVHHNRQYLKELGKKTFSALLVIAIAVGSGIYLGDQVGADLVRKVLDDRELQTAQIVDADPLEAGVAGRVELAAAQFVDIASGAVIAADALSSTGLRLFMLSTVDCYSCMRRVERWRGGRFESTYRSVKIVRIYFGPSRYHIREALSGIADEIRPGEVELYSDAPLKLESGAELPQAIALLVDTDGNVVAAGDPTSRHQTEIEFAAAVRRDAEKRNEAR